MRGHLCGGVFCCCCVARGGGTRGGGCGGGSGCGVFGFALCVRERERERGERKRERESVYEERVCMVYYTTLPLSCLDLYEVRKRERVCVYVCVWCTTLPCLWVVVWICMK